MRSFLLIVLLALVGAGAYGYINNPAVCRKLGTEVAADLKVIFTPGSGTSSPSANETTSPAAITDAQPRHWSQGFATDPNSQAAAPETAPTTSASVPEPVVANQNLVYRDSDFTDLDAALDASRKRHRPVVILFTGSDWCPYCQSLESEVTSTGAFEQYKDSHFVFMVVDDLRNTTMLDDEKARVDALEKQFRITGFPTMVVLDSNKTELGRMEGYSPGSGLAGVQSDLGKYLGN